MNKLLENQYLSTRELAELLRLKKNTIDRWRASRSCPFAWTKIGGHVLYYRDEVLAYLESQKRDNVHSITNGGNNAK